MSHSWQYELMVMFDACTKVANCREGKESSAKAKAEKKKRVGGQLHVASTISTTALAGVLVFILDAHVFLGAG
jgi:hypothetical protein